MKLKFKASAKDWIIFLIFCVVLLYFVALAVLNLSYFANYSQLWGFNPLPAFGPKYLLATLVGFGAALVAVFTSVSSYFFDREKGFGISTEPKKDKGYARWATEKEYKKELKQVDPGALTSEVAGIPLINNGKEIWVDAGEYHNLIIGSTGSGKTQIIVQPMVKMLAKKGESMIITDPKGEIYENNAVELREKGYNVVILNFRNPQQGNAWNPLTLPYRLYKNGNKDKANELLDDLAMNILYDANAQNQDPFWEKTSADYFTGLALGLFEDAKEEEINLNSINLMTTAGEEKCGPSTFIKEYFSFKSPSSPEYINVSSTLMAPNDTKQSILSVFKQKIKLFSSRENLSEMLGHSDFDMNDIGRKKTAVFIVIQDEKKTYHSLVTIFLKQCYETLIDVAQENGGKLAYKTNFILDEFANMPPLKDVTTMVTAARSRAIRFTFIIQNFAQLYQVYGKENGETIKGNCGNIIYLISSELAALEEISKMCGEVKSKEKDKTASTPLITVSDLQRLPKGTIVVLRTRMMPFKTKLMYNYQMELNNAWGKKYDRADYPQREKGVVVIFDIKSFVNKKRDERRDQILNNITSGNSSSGNQNSIPFMDRPQGNSNPFMPRPQGMNQNQNDLIKKIDAKIAELEAQEKAEKEQKAKESKPSIIAAKPVEPISKSDNGGLSDIERMSIKAAVSNALNSQLNPKKNVEVLPSKVDETNKATEALEQKKVDETNKATEALEQKKAEEAKKAAEALKQKKAEEAKKAAEALEQKKAEEAKKAAEALEQKKAEEAKKAAEALEQKKAEEAKKAAEALEQKKAEEAQKQLEREEEERKIAEAKEKQRRTEEARKAVEAIEQQKKAEDARKAAEALEQQRKAEEAKKAAEAKEKQRKEEEKLIEEAQKAKEKLDKETKKQQDLNMLQNKIKAQEKELDKALEQEKANPAPVRDEIKKDITEDQFFDDFFND